LSTWLAIALTIGGLAAVAVAVLVNDIASGDVGGGRGTMARARRLLIVSVDDETTNGAITWIEAQRKERPELQCFLVNGPDGQDLYMDVESAVHRERPDAIVVARHASDSHTMLEGIYGRLKEDSELPVDAIYVGEDAA
jgi:hypothetical protein